MASLIGSKESKPTSWFEVPVPPRFDNSDHLTIEKKENGSVVIVMNNNDKNQRCKVRYLAYLKYDNNKSMYRLRNTMSSMKERKAL